MRPYLKVVTIVIVLVWNGAVICAKCPKQVPNEEACTSYPKDQSLVACRDREPAACSVKKYIEPEDGEWGCRTCTEEDMASNVADCDVECLPGTTQNQALCWTETTCRLDIYSQDCQDLASLHQYKPQKIWDMCDGS